MDIPSGGRLAALRFFNQHGVKVVDPEWPIRESGHLPADSNNTLHTSG
jgi:hypothetical protein